MRKVMIAALAALVSTQAVAQNSARERREVADLVADTIAGEALCGYRVRASALRQFIDERIPASDIGFPGLLEGAVTVAEIRTRDLTGSPRVAHCFTVSRTARFYGLID